MKNLALTLSFVLMFFALSSLMVLHASEEDAPVSRVSMGIGITYGVMDFITTGSNPMMWENGSIYGAGFIFEYMWNDRFGVQSGLWYCVSSIDLRFSKDDPESLEVRSEHIILPIHFLISHRTGRFGVALAAGPSFMYVHETMFIANSSMEEDIDITEYMRYDLYGLSGGLQIKIGMTRFTDFFLGGMADIYLRGIIKSNENSQDYLYDFRLISGVMMRTF